MKPCRKPNQPPRRPEPPPDGPAAPAGPPPAALHRYVRPIRTSRPLPRPTAEEMLGDVLETLSRQSDQLNEVLRRLERDGSEG